MIVTNGIGTSQKAIRMFAPAEVVMIVLHRLGDHATNIAEHVIFILDGEDIRHLRLDALPENLTKLS